MRRARTASATLVLLASLAACSRGVPVEPTTATGTTPSSTTSTTTSGDPSGSSSASSAASATADVPAELTVGISFTSPGVGLRTPGGTTGLDADVARYVAGRIGSERVSFVEALPDQRETLLETGQVDMVVSSYSMTPERAQRVTFAGPYLTTGQDLLVRSTSVIRTPDELQGFTLCSGTGTSSTAELVDDHPGLHLVERRTVAECVEALADGEVKAVTSDAATLVGFAGASRSPDKLLLAGHPFTTEEWGIGLPHGDTAMCEAVTEALREMIRSGEWEKAVTRNLGDSELLDETTGRAPRLASCGDGTASSTGRSRTRSGTSSAAS